MEKNMESRIITIFENERFSVKWCRVTGKAKIEPGGSWVYPEGTDERVELCLDLCKGMETETLRELVEKGCTVAADPEKEE